MQLLQSLLKTQVSCLPQIDVSGKIFRESAVFSGFSTKILENLVNLTTERVRLLMHEESRESDSLCDWMMKNAEFLGSGEVRDW